MKKFLILIGILLLSLVFASLAAAQDDAGGPNDPTVNDKANACYAGGSLAGRCNVDFNADGVVEDYETEWVWECGWYLIRVQYGMLSAGSIPSRCDSVLPKVIPPGCFQFAYVPSSFEFNGTPNELGNATFYYTRNCSGPVNPISATRSVIVIDSAAYGQAICQGLGSYVLYFKELNTDGYNTPPGYYGCVVAG